MMRCNAPHRLASSGSRERAPYRVLANKSPTAGMRITGCAVLAGNSDSWLLSRAAMLPSAFAGVLVVPQASERGLLLSY